jgi:hypothetical protein
MAKALARSIKTKRDYSGATSLASKLREQSGRETEAERRLQALLEELEKFDDEDSVEDDADVVEDIDSLPRRRWSDESSGVE